MQQVKGFTILESIIVIAIMTGLLAVSYPYVQNFLYQKQADTLVNKLINIFNMATSYASYTNHELVYCATYDLVNCSDNWQAGFMLFVDSNKNLQLDKDEVVLTRQEAITHADSLTLRASGSIDYLKFTAGGNLHALGNFVYCNIGGNLQYSRKIVFNRAGRARVVEYQQLSC